MRSCRLIAVWLVLVTVSGCWGGSGASSPTRSEGRVPLVRAPADLRDACIATARDVGYPVPCPTRIPAGLRATRTQGACTLAIVGAGGAGGCSKAWRGWVVGSSETGRHHLVITASPRPLRSAARVVNGSVVSSSARPSSRDGDGRRPTHANGVRPPADERGKRVRRPCRPRLDEEGTHLRARVPRRERHRSTLELDLAVARGIELVSPR